MTTTRSPRISIVVPIRNEKRYIRECLASLLAQRYDSTEYEILVVDGGSDDGTTEIVAELAARHSNVRILENPSRIVSCGRNAGIRQARGHIIAFVEGHAFVDPGFLAEIERGFQNSEAKCLGRCVEQYIAGDNPVQQAIGLLRKSPLGRNPHSLRFTSGEPAFADPLTIATVYRREVFDKVGLFDETLATNEDVEFNWRVGKAGIQALRLPALLYHIHPRSTSRGFLKQMYWYGYGKALLVRRHPRAFLPAYAVPTGVLALALAGAACPLATLGLVPLMAYVALSAFSALSGVGGGARTYVGLRTVLSVLMLTGFGAGFALGLIGPGSMARRVPEETPPLGDTTRRWAGGRGEEDGPS